MKNKANDAHDAFVQSLNAGRRRRKLKILALFIVIAIAIAAFFVVRAIIRHKREVDAAKRSMEKCAISRDYPGGSLVESAL